jgi:AraC-like DNA-binding protein
MTDQVHYQHIAAIPGLVLSSAEFTDFDFARHFHLDFHIGLVSAGVQRQQFNGSTSYLAPGRIALMPAGEVHDGVRHGSSPCALKIFRLTPELLQAVSAELNHHQPVAVPQARILEQPRLAQQLLCLHSALHQRDAEPSLGQQSAWLSLLAQLLQATPVPPQRLTRQQWQEMQDYCQANLSEKITLDALAAVCQLGRFQFLRSFKHSMGMTPHAWLLRLRLERACQLLHHRGTSLTQIAQRVGFYDQSHFNHAFRLAFGVTPSQYAAQQ